MQSKIKKAFDALECAASSGKLPRPIKTAAAFYAALECLKALANVGTASTVQQEVSDFFSKHGFKVAEEGIGWRFKV